MRGTGAALLALVTLLGLATLACADVIVSSVGPSPEASPPGFATLVFRVSHAEAEPRTFGIEATVPLEWGVLSVPDPVTVGPGETQIVLITVRIPERAVAGGSPVEVAVTDLEDPGHAALAVQEVLVLPVAAVVLRPSVYEVVAPRGACNRFEIHVTNSGNEPAEIVISASSPWASEVQPAAARIPVGGEVTLTVLHHVPPDAMPGARVGLTVVVALPQGPRETVRLTSTVAPASASSGTVTGIVPLRGEAALTLGKPPGSEAIRSEARWTLEGTGFAMHGICRSLFGPDPVSLEMLTASFAASGATGILGDVSREISELLLISCRGGLIEIHRGLIEAALMAGGLGQEARTAAAFGFGNAIAQVRLAYAEWRSAVSRRAAWSLSATGVPLVGCSIGAEVVARWGLAPADWGWLGEASIALEHYAVRVELFHVGSDVPSPRAGRGGVSVHQSLELASLAMDIELARSVALSASGDPSEVTDRLGIALHTSGIPDAVSLSLNADWRRVAQIPIATDPAFAQSVEGTVRAFPHSLPITLTTRIWDADGPSSHVTGVQLRESVGLMLDGLRVSVSAEQNRLYDWSLPYWSREQDRATLQLAWDAPAICLRFGFLSRPSESELTVHVETSVIAPVRIALGAQLRWSDAMERDAALGWSLEFACDLSGVPFPFAGSSSRIEGIVFQDDDADGVHDPNEAGIPELLVNASGVLAVTDPQGRFRFVPLPSGEIALTIPRLPPDLVPLVDLPLRLRLASGEAHSVQLPVVRAAHIEGRLLLAAAAVSESEEGALALPPADVGGIQGGIPGVTVRLTGTGEQRQQVTAIDGSFRFERLRPGAYSVGIDTTTLPAFHAMAEAQVELPLVAGQSTRVDFHATPEPRPLRLIEDSELDLQRPS